MTVEVIGKDDNKYKKVTCRNCASILRYLPIDVQSKTARDYGGGQDTYYWVNCPTCGKTVNVSQP